MSEFPPAEEPHRSRRISSVILVIVLVAVVFVTLFEMGNAAITRRGRAAAFVATRTATSLDQAINQLYNEYGRMPDVGGDRVTTTSPEGVKLLNILVGADTKSNNGLNSRAIKFLHLKEGKNRKNGLVYAADGKSVVGLYDPWGNPYTVILDTESDEELHFTYGSRTINLHGRRNASFSPGADGKIGNGDDATTW